MAFPVKRCCSRCLQITYNIWGWSMMYVLPNPNWFLEFCLCLPAHHLNRRSTCLLLALCPQDWFVDSLSDTFGGPLASSMCPGMLRSACSSCVSTSGCCLAACILMKLVLKRALRSPSVAWIVYSWWTDLSRDERASPGISFSVCGSGIKFYMCEMLWCWCSCALAGSASAAGFLVLANSKETCTAVAA